MKNGLDTRCPWAVAFGMSLNTRCVLTAGHGELHIGTGLKRFADQRIKWHPGDAREFVTNRRDQFAWEEGSKR